MTSDRIKEIGETTAYPESRSVKQALLQVWNECEQDSDKYSEEDMKKAFNSSSLINMLDVYNSFEEFMQQFKKK